MIDLEVAPDARGGLEDDAPTSAAPPALPRYLRRRTSLGPRGEIRDRGLSIAGAALTFWFWFLVFGGLGTWLNLEYGYVFSDGLSRVANASYTIYSLDPHYAAIGFVWNPLPSTLEIPLLLFRSLWPPLMTRGIAGTIMSAAFMAGAVVQVRGIMVDRGNSRWWRFGLMAAFALNPMILIYGGNAMSEAPYIFMILWAVRRLIRWIHSDNIGDLVMAGLAVGLAYLTRYEALAVGVAGITLVLGIKLVRERSKGWRRSLRLGLLDAGVFGFPLAFCFALWTLASWVITGNAFAQFSSVYGNASQLGVGGLSGPSGAATFANAVGGPVAFLVRDLLALEPMMMAIVIVAVAMCWVHRDLDILPPVFLLGGALLFEVLTYLSGQLFPWFRYYITIIPLAVVLVALLLPATRQFSPYTPDPDLGPRHNMAPPDRRVRFLSGLGAAVLLLPAFPVGAAAVLNPNIGLQEYQVRSVLWPAQYPPAQEPALQVFRQEKQLADYLCAQKYRNGAVLMDTWLGWPVYLSSSCTHTFVITSDFDFVRNLNAPDQFGVQYFLVPAPKGPGTLDAINRRYPRLFATGSGMAVLVLDVPGIGRQPEWRLYKLLPQVFWSQA